MDFGVGVDFGVGIDAVGADGLDGLDMEEEGAGAREV